MPLLIADQSGNQLNINALSHAANVLLYDNAGNPLLLKNGQDLPAGGQSFLPIGGMNDGAGRGFRVDRFGNQRVGAEILLFRDSAETVASGTPIAPNLNQWATSVSGFAVGLATQNGNQLTATTVTTPGAYAIATSLRQFAKMQKVPLMMRCRSRAVIYTNTVREMGFGAPSGATSMIPNGAFWRYTASGQIVPVLAYNNSEVVGTDISALINAKGGNANYYTWEIIVDDDSVLFVCQDVTTGKSISEQSLQIGSGSPKIWAVTHLPIFERVYNATAPATGPTVFFSDVYVCSMDIWANKPWHHQMVDASNGGAEVYPGAYVAANAQNANYANSAAPASATLSNTAAGYATLGGQFQFAAVAGAETDYALFGFTVPAPFTFKCTGLRISSFNMGAAVATTPTILQWFAANNSSSINLTTAGLTRTPIGAQSFAIADPIGKVAADIDMPFDTPLRTDGGRLFIVGLKMPVGSATASQIIRGTVGVRGFFE
jgi:hypothetical protein